MNAEEYERLLRAQGSVGEEFFYQRLRSIRESIHERQSQIDQRAEIHDLLVRSINTEGVLKKQRLQFLAMDYSQERTELMREMEGLSREQRAELVRFQRDVAQWSKEIQEKREEYEGLLQLFRVMAVTKDGSDREAAGGIRDD